MSQTFSPGAATVPQLRSDLIVSRQGTTDISFVIKDPATGRFFRFKEIEGFILQQLDGATSLNVIQARVENTFGATLSWQNLEQFVEKLSRLGLLQTKTASEISPQKPGRVRGNLFYLRFNFFDPDAFFDRLIQRTNFFFTPAFIISSALITVFALGLTLANWDDIVREIKIQFRFQSFVIAWFTILGVIALHELAHGLTCKRFGGKVHEIGFLLIYFQPAFFCNVSDAWLFRQKSHRLWVTFAGAYFEIFLWATATVIWRVTDFSSVINYIALVVMATSGIKTLFNLNPLIKLDGYYLLSDFLEIPNLRQKAFSYLGALFKPFSTSAISKKQITPRERRIFFAYGLLAAVYSYWLIAFIALRFGNFLINRYQAWGFIVFAGLLVLIFRNFLRKGLQVISSIFKVRNGITAFIKRLAITSTVLALVAAVLYFCQMELKVSGEFNILPAHNAEIRAEVEGIIREINKDEGDVVTRGDVIARLSDRDCRSELQKIKAELEERQAKLKLLKAGARSEELDLARTSITKGEERLKFSKSHLEMDKSLYEQKLLSRKEFEDTEELVAVRDKEVQEAKQKLTLLLAGNRPEEIEAIEAEINRLKAQQHYLEEQLQLLVVASPISGVITTHKLKEKIGQNIKKGDLIAVVHQLKTVTAEIVISEKEISDVKLGQKVMLKARSHSDSSFFGKVISIAPIANKQTEANRDRTLTVITELDNTSLLLKSDMSGNAKIYCGKQRLWNLITRRLVRYIRVEFWSWW
ncbi:MAG: efflux RND transporter periplasmic adaptor subunit [Verrucomicrobiota bacterium]